MLSVDIEVPRRNFGLQVAFDIEADQRLALYGPSGAGKTTTLAAVAGLEPISAGRISLNGRLLSQAKPRLAVPLAQRRVGLLRQQPGLFPHLSAARNIVYGCHRSEQEVSALVELLQLTALLRARPDSLSGGQQQRVALARVLLSDASVLLLDEPFTGLEPEFRLKLSGEVVKWSQSHKAPVVLVTHDLEEAQSFGTLLGVIDSGRLLQIGDPHLTVRRPASIRAASLLGYRNILPARILGINASWCAIHPQTIIPPEGAAQAALHFQATVLDNRPQGLGWTVTVALAEDHCLVGHLPRPLAVGTTVVLGMPPPPAYDQAERLLPAPA